jgi:hypothetical protein
MIHLHADLQIPEVTNNENITQNNSPPSDNDGNNDTITTWQLNKSNNGIYDNFGNFGNNDNGNNGTFGNVQHMIQRIISQFNLSPELFSSFVKESMIRQELQKIQNSLQILTNLMQVFNAIVVHCNNNILTINSCFSFITVTTSSTIHARSSTFPSTSNITGN